MLLSWGKELWNGSAEPQEEKAETGETRRLFTWLSRMLAPDGLYPASHPTHVHTHSQPIYYGNRSTRAPRLADSPYLHQVY